MQLTSLHSILQRLAQRSLPVFLRQLVLLRVLTHLPVSLHMSHTVQAPHIALHIQLAILSVVVRTTQHLQVLRSLLTNQLLTQLLIALLTQQVLLHLIVPTNLQAPQQVTAHMLLRLLRQAIRVMMIRKSKIDKINPGLQVLLRSLAHQ